MDRPRADTRGILDAAAMMRRVHFRRQLPADPTIRTYVEHYWLIDWDLEQPFEQHVLPHPSVNVVFQRYGSAEPFGEIAGVGLGLFSIKLEEHGWVRGVQFRPGGFRPFYGKSVAELTNHRVPINGLGEGLDARLAEMFQGEDPHALEAMRLVDDIRHDRDLRRVEQLASKHGLSIRRLQRLFAEYVGVSPKWVFLRYRIHEALERASDDTNVDWAGLAADLGYSDQAHLVRDFTTTIGLSPTAYRALLS